MKATLTGAATIILCLFLGRTDQVALLNRSEVRAVQNVDRPYDARAGCSDLCKGSAADEAIVENKCRRPTRRKISPGQSTPRHASAERGFNCCVVRS